jgi:hypothetical protein
LVTFVIDRSAQTDADPQTVPLPLGIDPHRIVASPLVLIDDREPGRTPPVPRIGGVVTPLLVDGRIEIRVSIPPDIVPKPVGQYLSVVYERKAGQPPPKFELSNPPPRPVIATVLVLFVDSPI